MPRPGLSLDPASEQLRSALEEAKASARPARNNLFGGPDLIAKLAQDPRGRAALEQPDFQRMLSAVQRDPSALNMYLADPRMQLVRRRRNVPPEGVGGRGRKSGGALKAGWGGRLR